MFRPIIKCSGTNFSSQTRTDVQSICSFQDPQRNSSASRPESVEPIQADSQTQKKHPVPQLIGSDGLPVALPRWPGQTDPLNTSGEFTHKNVIYHM